MSRLLVEVHIPPSRVEQITLLIQKLQIFLFRALWLVDFFELVYLLSNIFIQRILLVDTSKVRNSVVTRLEGNLIPAETSHHR
jgi:hypothetical protein